ncbi:MAG: RNA polymerase sigma-70 factor [Patescibacteria group bacterium]|jgi:RNA polymerase sigma-70 factor (family 1)|nr:RNA polymerase sigma-70 factor [Patescibacteria group bacterium]
MKNNNDQLLVMKLRKNDHESFKLLFEKYSSPLYNFAFSYLKSNSAAEDIVQEVFIKIWEKRSTLISDSNLKAYIFKIALNAMRKQFLKLSKDTEAKHDILFDISNDKNSFDDNNDYDFLLSKLNELIEQMPEKRKLVFIKKKLEEKSIKEIATELDLSPKTVEYHVTEAMKFLKNKFEKLNFKGLIFFYLFIKK